MNSSPKIELKLDWCDFKTAKYAVEKWHYSRSMPAGKRVQIGVWEQRRFIGAVVFGYGIQQFLGKQFGLVMTECVELCRVALDSRHQTPVTKIVSIALKMLKRQSPGLRLVISYADVDQNHHGGIYIAGNWVYLGMTQTNGGTPKFLVNGKLLHGRQVHSLWGKGSQQIEWLQKHKDPNACKVFTNGKHKYAYPLDDAMRKQITPLAKPYPKHAAEVNQDAPGVQPGEDGATPIQPLK